MARSTHLHQFAALPRVSSIGSTVRMYAESGNEPVHRAAKDTPGLARRRLRQARYSVKNKPVSARYAPNYPGPLGARNPRTLRSGRIGAAIKEGPQEANESGMDSSGAHGRNARDKSLAEFPRRHLKVVQQVAFVGPHATQVDEEGVVGLGLAAPELLGVVHGGLAAARVPGCRRESTRPAEASSPALMASHWAGVTSRT